MPGPMGHEVTVVLILPELLGPLHDSRMVRGTLTSHARMRVLVSLLKTPDPAFFAYLATHEIRFQVLLAPELPKPCVAEREVNMPPGSDDKEQTQLAIALADVVL